MVHYVQTKGTVRMLGSHTRSVNKVMRLIQYNSVLTFKPLNPELNPICYLLALLGAHRSSGQSFWLQIQRSRVRFPALPDFLSSSGSGTGSTQPREIN